MRILILSRYGPLGATTRYRFLQYVPSLERAGHQITLRALLDDLNLIELYTRGRRNAWRVLKGYARRGLDILTLNDFDAVICEQEVFPFLPALVERTVAKRHPRFILDYDDAAYVKYESWAVLRRKIPLLMAAADSVVVGNRHLEEYARQFTAKVVLIPTVVDLSRYPNRQASPPGATVRIVWIGTPVTAKLLAPLARVFEELQRRHPNLVLRAIGAGAGLPWNSLHVERFNWSEDCEGQLLAESDIGIMPLSDADFARGKCGLKLIQCMACSLPVVASPFGVNCEIVRDSENGFWAATESEWLDRLDTLIRSPELRRKMGLLGRARVASEFTLEQGLSKWRELLEGGWGLADSAHSAAMLQVTGSGR